MNPVWRIFGIWLLPLHADAQNKILTFMGTNLDLVGKHDGLPLRRFSQSGFTAQRLQLRLYMCDIVEHGQATGVGLFGAVMNTLSCFKSTQSSGLYRPLSLSKM